MNLNLNIEEVRFLGLFIEGVLLKESVIYELEQAVLKEFYERKIKLFTFPKRTRFKIKNSEKIALQRVLLNIPLKSEYSILQIIRNTILTQLNKMSMSA